MAKLGEELDEIPSGPASAGPARRSIWPSIYPRLVELVRAHRSTMIFANSRRLAERLAGALNETAGEEIALAHHGSISREKRLEIEDRLKRGQLPAIVATSSLELGIDMGAVDLVVQIEAPPSIASGLQRIGRAGHGVGEASRGILFPKYRGDLLAAAAATARMAEGRVEETTYPRNPLDVLAQQIVAIVASEPHRVEDLYRLVRRAAPFAELPRASFEGVLDMLSGRYPSDEFAELRPRVTWDRVGGEVRAREGARRVAVVNAGTIPDRGLYGVFLAGGDPRRSLRVGELDEEMVFESRPGDVFVLGASSWRIDEITHDRVLVTPAPGLPGKMPFWHGDRPGRPPEFGAAIGELARELSSAKGADAERRLRDGHGLDPRAATNLVAYLRDQREATGEVPSDRTLVVERFVDEIGDWRVCVLSPLGARVHAPWATAVLARLRSRAPPTSRRSGPTTAWCSASRSPTSRPTRRCSFRRPTRSRTSSCGTSARPRSSRRASARTPRGPCSCRAGTRAAAARSGRSASAPPTCSPWPRATGRSRSSSRPTASACATSSTCRAWSTSCARSRRAGSASSRSIRAPRRRSPRRSSSPTSRTSSTTATRPWPSAARRRCRSTRRSCGSSSARPSCASSSIRTRSPPSKPRSSGSRAGGCGTRTACTTCCCRSET